MSTSVLDSLVLEYMTSEGLIDFTEEPSQQREKDEVMIHLSPSSGRPGTEQKLCNHPSQVQSQGKLQGSPSSHLTRLQLSKLQSGGNEIHSLQQATRAKQAVALLRRCQAVRSEVDAGRVEEAITMVEDMQSGIMKVSAA